MFKQAVLQYFRASETEPSIIEQDSGLDPSALKKAIVILHAVWSGSSAACLRCLASVSVSSHEPWLYVVNTDTVSRAWMEKHFGGISHGRGETFWIKDGHIEHRDESYALRSDDVAKAVSALFNGPNCV